MVLLPFPVGSIMFQSCRVSPWPREPMNQRPSEEVSVSAIRYAPGIYTLCLQHLYEESCEISRIIDHCFLTLSVGGFWIATGAALLSHDALCSWLQLSRGSEKNKSCVGTMESFRWKLKLIFACTLMNTCILMPLSFFQRKRWAKVGIFMNLIGCFWERCTVSTTNFTSHLLCSRLLS
jgi:hypothetical protein